MSEENSPEQTTLGAALVRAQAEGLLCQAAHFDHVPADEHATNTRCTQCRRRIRFSAVHGKWVEVHR